MRCWNLHAVTRRGSRSSSDSSRSSVKTPTISDRGLSLQRDREQRLQRFIESVHKILLDSRQTAVLMAHLAPVPYMIYHWFSPWWQALVNGFDETLAKRTLSHRDSIFRTSLLMFPVANLWEVFR